MEKLTNQTIIEGTVTKVYPIKYTLQRVPISYFVLTHQSQQQEGGGFKEVKCNIYCIMLNLPEKEANKLKDQQVTLSGFLSQNKKGQLVLNVIKIDGVTINK